MTLAFIFAIAFTIGISALCSVLEAMILSTTTAEIDKELNAYNKQGFGRTTSGCGGGYIFVATQDELPNSFRPKIPRQKL